MSSTYNLDTVDDSPRKNEGQVNLGFEGLEPGLDSQKKSSNAGSVTAKGPEGEEGPIRDEWNNPIEFLLSCIAMSVGLGNIWRFPYTAYKNGGGAFLIPYLVVLTFIGRPIYFLELALGQFAQFGQVKVWNLSPLFTGVGYGSMVGTICVVSYYASIMALTVYYLFASMQADLPWTICRDEWVSLGAGHTYNTTSEEWETLMCNPEDLSSAYLQTENGSIGNLSFVSIPQLYFENEVLKQKDHIDDGIGLPDWKMALCLLLSWLLIWGTLVKGVSSSGKVAYFTAIFPYVVLTIMLIRGATLDGAWDGIKFFITPQWDKMLEPDVWYAAVGQCFFSLSTGFGPIIMFASYNPFKHNIYRDAWIISGMDTFTSLFAGFTIFSVLGNLAKTLNLDVDKVAKGGPGLAFVSFAQGLSTFDWVPQLFSVLFFLMLFTLGIGSATSLTGGIITIICDQFPKRPRWLITTAVCVIGFLVGLIYVTPGGQFMLELVDHFGANFVIYVMATVEVMGIAWVYGLNNFLDDIEFMLGFRVGWYWKFCWGFFVPVGLTAIFIYSLVKEKRLTYNEWSYPDSAIVCGWMIAVVALSLLPICAYLAFRKTDKSLGVKDRLIQASKPTKDWGPRKAAVKQEWIAFKTKQT